MSAGFVAAIFEQLAAGGSRAAVTEVHGAELRATGCAALLATVARMRGGLRALGVKDGDRVALFAPNGALWIAADLALLAEGVTVVPFYARQALSEVASMGRDADVALVVASAKLAPELRAAWPGAPSGRAGAGRVPTIVTLEGLDAGAAVLEPPRARAAGAIVTIVYTSGTSGEPKGAMIARGGVDHVLAATAEQLANMMRAANAARPRGGGAPTAPPAGRGRRVPPPVDATHERVFHYLPFCFMGSRIVLWTCLFRGGGIFVSTSLENLAEELRTARPHWVLNVPALLERIKSGVETELAKQRAPIRALYARAVDAHARGGRRLRDRALIALARRVVLSRIRAKIGPELVALICGSAPLRASTQRWFQLLGIPVYQVYGLTETTAIVTMDEPGRERAGRVGVAIPGCELRVGDDGELLVRGPNVFAGYFRKPEATARALGEGWLRTGDRVELDDAGSLAVLGRVSSVLVPESGHNVVPEPIEERLLAAIPGAEHAVVVGHARPYLAALVTGDVKSDDVAAAVERVNEDLPHYRRLRRFVVLGERFTIESGLLTANQKLKRRAIEDRFKERVEELYR